MFFTPLTRSAHDHRNLAALDRYLNRWQDPAFAASATCGKVAEASSTDAAADKPAQDDKNYTFAFDVPGISKEHLSIGIEGNIVRLESKPDAPRRYKAAYELPQDIDVSASEAKLENGVLTLKLAKKEANVTQLTVN